MVCSLFASFCNQTQKDSCKIQVSYFLNTGGTQPETAQIAGKSRLHPTEQDNYKIHHSKPPVWLLVVEVMTGVSITSLFLIALLTFVLRCKSKPSVLNLLKRSTNNKHDMSIHIDSNMLKGVTRYNRQELEIACEDFSNIIGSSSDSLVYKGIIKGGPEIAVISLCIKEEHWTGYIELYYQKEVNTNLIMNPNEPFLILNFCVH